MDPALEESSRMSGASPFRTFLRVTLGLMLPVTTGGFLLAFVRGVEAFESPMFFGTPARIHVLTTEIYNSIHHETAPDYRGATALAIAVMGLLSLLIAWQWRILGSRSFLTITGRGYRPRVTPLGRWRWATLSVVIVFLLVVVALPVGQLALGSFFRFFGFYQSDMLTLEHYREVWESRLFWRALSNTLLLGFAGATAAMLLGSLAAYTIVRTRASGRRLIEVLAWLPWMMPGIVLGLGLLWAYAFLPGPFAIYGTRWALGIAYLTLCLPLAVRTMAGALAAIGSDLEECSRVHGAGFWTTFRRILLALSWPSFAVGWILLFFIILRELSASILLYGPGSEVLSVVVMRLWSEGKAEEVSVIALLMLGLIFVFRFLESRIVKRHEVSSW
jgi:iron(III) transport system permease protein